MTPSVQPIPTHRRSDPAFRPQCILIVDDEAAVRSSLSGILSDEGYRVDAVETGETGVRAVESTRYELAACRGVDPERRIPRLRSRLSLEGRGGRVSKGKIGVYRRHQPESTALYEVVRDNHETLLGAIDEGALAVRIPKYARADSSPTSIAGFSVARLRARGFAQLECRACDETRLVTLSCKERGSARRA